VAGDPRAILPASLTFAAPARFALTDAGKTALGVARFAADPDNRSAEYAVAVRSDWKGRGLGYLLMTRLIEIARDRGIGLLVGEVLAENAAMLQMCRELGFRIRHNPADATIVQVEKPLSG
jgi:acetyltransferase